MRLSSSEQDQARDFYLATGPRLIGMLHALTGSRADAEDAAQEAFVRLLQRWAKIARYDSPEAWLRLVAIRVALDRQKKSRRESPHEHTELGPASQSTDVDRRIDAERLLTTLPPQQRHAAVLFYLCDMPVEEVARVLDASPSAIKTRLHRARTTLAAAPTAHLQASLTLDSEETHDA